MSKKEDLINRHIPPALLEYLKGGRFISIGATIYKATVKLKNIRSIASGKEYSLDFIEVPKEFVKDLNSSDFIKDIYKYYNCDYSYPIPCNIQSEFEFIVDGIIWNSYNYPPIAGMDTGKVDADVEAKCPMTMRLFRHIYGDSLKLALDYMTVEFNNPTQPLPVQVLYSRENNTGKTTILQHRRMIYGNNASVIDSGTFDDKFNGLTVGKNFVGIDEGKLGKDTSLETLKAKVTNPTVPYRAMRKAAIEVPNFGKWAIATNKWDWAKLDREDSRFWVIKVPVMPSGNYDPKFDEKLKKEASYWIDFLMKRWSLRGKKASELFKMDYPEKMDRLWFKKEVYETEALMNTKRNSINLDSKTLLNELLSWFHEYNSNVVIADRIFEIYANTSMIRNHLFTLPQRITTPVIKNILEHDLELLPVMNKKGTAAANLRFTNYFEKDRRRIQTSNVYLIRMKDIAELLGADDSLEYSDAEDINKVKPEAEQLEFKHKK